MDRVSERTGSESGICFLEHPSGEENKKCCNPHRMIRLADIVDRAYHIKVWDCACPPPVGLLEESVGI